MRSRLSMCVPSALVAMGLCLAEPSVSNAVPTVNSGFVVVLSDGTPADTLVIPDNGTGAGGINGNTADGSGLLGTINFSGTIGSVTITSLSVQVQTNGITTVTLNSSSSAAVNLKIVTSAIGFTGSGSSVVTSTLQNNNSGNDLTTASLASYVDTTNTGVVVWNGTAYVAGTPTQTIGPSAYIGTPNQVGTVAATDVKTLGVVLPSSFALGQTIVVNYTAGNNAGSSQMSADITATTQYVATPAPSSAILAMAGMPVFGLMWMIRRRRSKVDGVAPAIA